MSVEREQVKQRYEGIFDRIAEILFRHDPMGINFEDNTDEYESEVSTILPHLESVSFEQETLGVTHQEFGRWFGEDLAGSKSRYKDAAAEIWSAWLSYKAHNP